VRLSAHLEHLRRVEPALYHRLSAGVRWPGQHLEATLEVGDRGRQEYVGTALARWGEREAEKILAEFRFKKGNSMAAGYFLTAQVSQHDLLPYGP